MKQLGFQVKPKLFYCKLTNSKEFHWMAGYKDNQEHAQGNTNKLNDILEKYT